MKIFSVRAVVFALLCLLHQSSAFLVQKNSSVPKPFPSPNKVLENNEIYFLSRYTKSITTELRAGGSISIPGCAPLNAIFVTYPYAAAFIICEL